MALQEVVVSYPKVMLFVFSLVVTIISTFAHKYLTDQEHLHNQKKRQDELRQQFKSTKDPQEIGQINAELAKISFSMVRHSFRPMVFTLVPFLLFFFWLRSLYEPILSSWLWWYLGFAVVTSMILRKIFKVA